MKLILNWFQDWFQNWLERLVLKLKLQYFGHLMQRANSLEKTMTLGRLRAGGEGDDRGWDGWMASLTQWTRIWANSGRWWRAGKPGVLRDPVYGATTQGLNNGCLRCVSFSVYSGLCWPHGYVCSFPFGFPFHLGYHCAPNIVPCATPSVLILYIAQSWKGRKWVDHGILWIKEGIVVVQSLSHVCLFETPWTIARQAPLSATLSRSLLISCPLSGDAIQPSHPLLPSSPFVLSLSQHQGLFYWVGSLHQVAKLLELQLQHQSFQWISKVDFL